MSWDESIRLYTDYIQKSSALVILDSARIVAVRNRQMTDAARKSASEAETKRYAPDWWAEAAGLQAEGNTAFVKMEFTLASKLFRDAEEKYNQGEEKSLEVMAAESSQEN